MDVRQLKCFDAVLSTGAMTRAAQLLGLAQPTVSITIAQLEREIGFVLFKRSKGKLEPTPEAYSFHEAALQALDSIARVSQVAQQIQRLNAGEVSILCYPGIAWRLMPELIKEFRTGRDDIQIKLISRSSVALRQLILAQNYDLAIIESPVLQPTGNTELYRYDCLCALPEHHALAKKKTISPRDLDGLPFVTLFPDHATNHQIRRAFGSEGAHLNVALECDFFASACSFVSAGGGFTIIDPITATQFVDTGVVLRKFAPIIEYEIAMVRPKDRPSSRLADEFHLRLSKQLDSLQG